jgi:hypothetical protein
MFAVHSCRTALVWGAFVVLGVCMAGVPCSAQAPPRRLLIEADQDLGRSVEPGGAQAPSRRLTEAERDLRKSVEPGGPFSTETNTALCRKYQSQGLLTKSYCDDVASGRSSVAVKVAVAQGLCSRAAMDTHVAVHKDAQDSVSPPPAAMAVDLQGTVAKLTDTTKPCSEQPLFNPCGGNLPRTNTPEMSRTLEVTGVVDGIVGWISNMTDMVGGFFTDLFDGLLGGVMNFFGIGDEASSALADMAGIAQCIGPMDIPSINNLMSGLEIPSLPGCLGGGGGSGGGGTTVTTANCADILKKDPPEIKKCAPVVSFLDDTIICPAKCTQAQCDADS